MPSTDEIRAVDVYDIEEIRKRVLDVVERLRRVDAEVNQLDKIMGTLGTLADKLDQLAQNLKPPDLHDILSEIDAPYAVPNARYLAERLTEAIFVVTELMADAEITGSVEAHAKARAWLEKLGILSAP